MKPVSQQDLEEIPHLANQPAIGSQEDTETKMWAILGNQEVTIRQPITIRLQLLTGNRLHREPLIGNRDKTPCTGSQDKMRIGNQGRKS